MKKLFLFLILCVLIPSVTCGAATYTAASHSRTDVATAIGLATRGDTVIVPVGDGIETWATGFSLTEGITLAGPGSASLNITISSGYAITYTPSAASRSANTPFELYGFTFTGASGVNLVNTTTTVCTQIKIHDNVFLALTGSILDRASHFGGVFYNNTGTSSADWIIDMEGGGATTWNNFAWSAASSTAFYVEDNDLTTTKAGPQPIVTGNGSYPFVIRYNTIRHTGDGNMGALFDIHGNQGTGNVYGGLGAEYYGNKIVKSIPGGNTDKFLYHRGGEALVFYNKSDSTSLTYFHIWEDVIDSYNPTSGGGYPSGDNQIDGEPQHVSNSYYWNNRYGSNTLMDETYTVDEDCAVVHNGGDDCVPPGSVMAQDKEFYPFTESSNGTSGTGCGSSLPATCVSTNPDWPANSGPGFFVPTNIATIPCSSVADNNVGKAVAVPITGTLYRCISNVWVDYYTPYTYPHPLRGTTPPSAQGCTISGGTFK